MLRILCIKLNYDLNIDNYLHWFEDNVRIKIKQFKQYKDQVTAFSSELIKHYYLARLLHINPAQIQIEYSHHGRPFIANTNIDFNISHSKDYILLAVSDKFQVGKVGIDIEQLNSSIDPGDLSPHVFSDAENNYAANSLENFFILWTKKEALLKARGTGFGTEEYKSTKLTLDQFEELPDAIIYSHKSLFPNYSFALCILKA